MHTLILAAGIFAGGAAYRLRGDTLWSVWTGGGIGTARIMCAAVLALGLAADEWAAGRLDWAPLAVGAALFIGLTKDEAGRNKADPPFWPLLTGCLCITLPAAAVLFGWRWVEGHGFAWGWVAAAGPAIIGVYAAAKLVPQASGPQFLHGGSELAEFLTGLLLAAALALAVLTA